MSEMSDTKLSMETAFGVASRYANKAAVAGVVAGGVADDVIAVLPYMDDWASGRAYAVGDAVAWAVGGRAQPMSCVTAHDTGVHPDWDPDSAVSLWRAWHATGAEFALPYLMRDSRDAYRAGEFVTWGAAAGAEGDGSVGAAKVYLCLEDNTVWSPGERAEAWQVWPPVVEAEVQEAGDGEVGEDLTGEGGDGEDVPSWVQPTGAHDAYALGATVRHNGLLWVNKVDGNAYAPDVFGWEAV